MTEHNYPEPPWHAPWRCLSQGRAWSLTTFWWMPAFPFIAELDDTRVRIREWPFTLLVIAASYFLSFPFFAGLDVSFALETEAVWHGEVWRFCLSPLVHMDLVHLWFNLFWLAHFGQAIERRFGSMRVALLYVLVALGSGTPEFLLANGGLGLSGVVFGFFGFVLATRHAGDPLGKCLDGLTILRLIAWFLVCLAVPESDDFAVANIAHGGGLVFGYLLGRAAVSRRRVVAIAACATLVAALTVTTQYMPWSFVWSWIEADRQFDDERYLEARASYERAYELSPPEAEADLLVCLAVTSHLLDRFGEAVMWYEEAIRVSRDSGPIRAYLAHAYYMEGDEDQARVIARTLRKRDFDEFLLSDPYFMALTPFGGSIDE